MMVIGRLIKCSFQKVHRVSNLAIKVQAARLINGSLYYTWLWGKRKNVENRRKGGTESWMRSRAEGKVYRRSTGKSVRVIALCKGNQPKTQFL